MAYRHSGIVIVDKPPGLSSAKLVAAVKGLFHGAKVGHAGTLDPFATGVMVCLINQATRLSRFMLHGVKTYQGTLRLGVETDTQDATGDITGEKEVPALTRAALEAAFGRFVGTMAQLPPVYSALKHKGVPLYKLARQGRPVQKPARKITINALDILDVDLPRIRFQVSCSSGTYVRTLCADIGKAIGCGGHLEALRRTRSSGFDLDQAVTLGQLEARKQDGTLGQVMIGMAESLPDLPVFFADSVLAKKIAVGQLLSRQEMGPVDDATDRTDFARVIDDSGALLAVLETGHETRFRYCCVFAHDGDGQMP
jgi:tRNA pseudouridine55 synthase